MPLTAIVASTQTRITIQDDVAFAKAHKDELLCPYCDQPLIPVRDFLRQGQYVTAYARHKGMDGHYETEYRYHPESREHLTAKAYLAQHAGELFGVSVVSYEFEVRLPEVRRIADVRLLIEGGDYLIVEAQLAAITPEELQERTHDYEQLGYAVCWCLGKAAYKDHNYRWCLDHTGVCGRLGFTEEVDTLGAIAHGRVAA